MKECIVWQQLDKQTDQYELQVNSRTIKNISQSIQQEEEETQKIVSKRSQTFGHTDILE